MIRPRREPLDGAPVIGHRAPPRLPSLLALAFHEHQHLVVAAGRSIEMQLGFLLNTMTRSSGSNSWANARSNVVLPTP